MRAASSGGPLVSILVVTFTQHQLFARCLDSLAGATRGFATETIVVVNGVPLLREHRAAEVTGAILLHAPVNLGLPGGLQYARSHARGRYLAVVQDDVEVDEHWLVPLLEVLERDPTVGAVGSRVSLRDGSPFGDGLAVDRRGHCEIIEPAERPAPQWTVDGCFSASCLVRADAWDSVGGPNPRLFPNQYVDVDFGLRLAEADWSVLMARDSVVRHVRNASTTTLLRNYLVARNNRTVAREHRGTLEGRPECFLGADEIEVWLVHLSAVAQQRRSSSPPERTARPAIPLAVLIRDARSDARRVRVGLPVFGVTSALPHFGVRTALRRRWRERSRVWRRRSP